MPVPVAVSNAAAPMTTAAAADAAASPAVAPAAAAAAPAAKPASSSPSPVPAPKAATTSSPSPSAPPSPSASPSSFVAYTLSAAQATLSPDPASEGLATLILTGVSNTTIPRGSAGVLSGPLHTPTFLATSFPAGSTVELRGSAAAGGGGDWGSAYLRKASLVATGAADGVAVISGVVVPASLGDAGAATIGAQRGTLAFNKVSVLVTAPPKKWEGASKVATQKLTTPTSPAPAPAAPAVAASAAKNATAATSTKNNSPKVSVAAATRPATAAAGSASSTTKQAVAKSIPMPSEFSN